ncbi:MAG: LysR family transcriptional regulator [Desulfovibrio sp.]|jgi:DNA-binding transcriptional LysR family regulator|nr:LysR family transcriptional regulator [Desulfovibrio sp.]MBI4960059.1 LysR family transcriptional regulator [Desulfovibrio sp.]
MDIRRLEAFKKVYELGSFSKAGVELFLSQPTISAHVLSLEQELGTQLFDRLGRTILPTQAGEILYRHALQVFASIDSATAEIGLLQKRVAGELLLGGSTIPATYLLPQRLAEFTKLYHEVRVRLTVGDSQDIINAVQDGRLALGVVGAAANDPDLVFSSLLEDELVIVASKKLPGMQALIESGDPVIAPDQLAAWPWVLREQGSGTRKAFENALAEKGLDIRFLTPVIEARSHEAVVQCSLHGLGLCVTSKLAVGPCLTKGDLIPVRVPGLTIHRSFYVVRHAKRHIFPAMRYFIDFLKDTQG